MTMTPAQAHRASGTASFRVQRASSAEIRPARTLMRKYDVTWLDQAGNIHDLSRAAPAIAAFEDAFAAFARGTIVSTEHGPVAVEDLLPGDRIKTVEAGFQPLLWRGATTLVPRAAGQAPHMGSLTRIAADALGVGRPMPDLVLGPKARTYHRSQAAQRLTRADGAFLPVRDLIDGCNVIELTPMSPVQVFHLGLAGHHRILANGVELESHHPGTLHDLALRGETLELYMSLFPHMGDFASFGPARYARLRMSDLEMVGVA
ncbi:Hint domain-containing protein [Roseisalinus antarcticus]|uniref:Hedgehog/Intein (Hint) domain-containing protein n=1 Tax=Roseisalinus antarcticus TaxID=254357 RepID=A0A1Y5S046_9RHOB|nr:Hint domain-containing protein [Roseisalinus antarcticus]SLN26912.1 hypothetical protein ROA7023_00843 [Roseisalinus antarcticus]